MTRIHSPAGKACRDITGHEQGFPAPMVVSCGHVCYLARAGISESRQAAAIRVYRLVSRVLNSRLSYMTVSS